MFTLAWIIFGVGFLMFLVGAIMGFKTLSPEWELVMQLGPIVMGIGSVLHLFVLLG